MDLYLHTLGFRGKIDAGIFFYQLTAKILWEMIRPYYYLYLVRVFDFLMGHYISLYHARNIQDFYGRCYSFGKK